MFDINLVNFLDINLVNCLFFKGPFNLPLVIVLACSPQFLGVPLCSPGPVYVAGSHPPTGHAVCLLGTTPFGAMLTLPALCYFSASPDAVLAVGAGEPRAPICFGACYTRRASHNYLKACDFIHTLTQLQLVSSGAALYAYTRPSIGSPKTLFLSGRSDCQPV